MNVQMTTEDRHIHITVPSAEIDLLKEEIKEYIIQEVEKAISSKLQSEKTEEELQKLKMDVQDVFTKGNDLSTGSNRSQANTSQDLNVELDVKEVCRKKLEAEWIQQVSVKVLQTEDFEEPHALLQKGIMVDRVTGWKFPYAIFRKSRRLKLEKDKKYVIGPVVSSVYEDVVEFHLNSKTAVNEAE